MDFRTVVPPVEGKHGLVRHGEPILLVGSCFSDNIGSCLVSELFEADVNPFGPLYNPLSISKAFELLAGRVEVPASTLVMRDGAWVSTLFHSRVSDADRDSALGKMNRTVNESGATLRSASVVIITLGTTRVFTLRDGGSVVANCHKLPGSMFDVRYLTLEEVTEALRSILSSIRSVNAEAEVMFTVSPLRYSEQGAHGNQLSKATLLLGVDSLIRSSSDPKVSYFPAYEVMMDDLRDYRFYAEDMKHPTQQAVRYIYDLFKTSYFDEETLRLAGEAASLTRRLAHRSLTASPDVAAREAVEKTALADAFTGRFPKLKRACARYLSIILNDGIQHF